MTRVLGSDAARAVGRFNPDGPLGYRAASMPGAPLRATRAEAEADELAHLTHSSPPSVVATPRATGQAAETSTSPNK